MEKLSTSSVDIHEDIESTNLSKTKESLNHLKTEIETSEKTSHMDLSYFKDQD